MSRVRENLIRKLVRELIKQELDEANSTASVGGEYQTPHSFKGSNKKGKKKGKAGYTGGHEDPTIGTANFNADDPKLRKESVVNEGSISPAQAGKLFDKLLKKQTKGNLPSPKDIETVFSLMRVRYGIKSESVNEEKQIFKNIYLQFTVAVQDFNDRCIEIADKITDLKGDKTDGKILMTNVKKHLIPIVKLMNSWNKGQQKNPNLTTEGKYHDYRNDDTMTPKQKIGMAMRETRDSLKELESIVKNNVRLKTELNVDSRSYWKNTHKALSKISERLVNLANKVGQLH